MPARRSSWFSTDAAWTQSLVRWSALLLPISAVMGPFLSISPGRSGFPYGYRLLAVLLACTLLPIALRRGRPTDWISWSLIAVTGVLCLWAPVTLLWSPAGRAGASEFIAPALACLCALVVLLAMPADPCTLRRMRQGWVISLGLGLVLTAIEAFTAWHPVFWAEGKPNHFVLVWSTGFRHNPNDYAATMMVASIVMISMLLRRQRVLTVLTAGVALVGMGYLTVATSSRAAFVALVLVIGLGLVWLVFAAEARRLLVAGVLAVGLVSGGVLNGMLPGTQTVPLRLAASSREFQPKPQAKRNQYTPVAPPATDTQVEQLRRSEKVSDNKRLTLTLLGLDYYASAPVLGHGAGYYRYAQPKDMRVPYYWPEALHNAYLQMAVSYGLPFLLTVASFYLAAASAVGRRVRRVLRNPLAFELLGVLGMTLLFSVMSSFALTDVAFWFALAYAGLLAQSLRTAHVRRVDPDGSTGDAAVSSDSPPRPAGAVRV